MNYQSRIKNRLNNLSRMATAQEESDNSSSVNNSGSKRLMKAEANIMTNPIKKNDDYTGNFIDKLQKRLDRKKKRKETKNAISNLLSGEQVVGYGDNDKEALQVQRELAEAGYLSAQEVQGNFGAESDIALRTFQQDADLIEDGIAGEWVAGTMSGDIPISTPEPVESLLHDGENIAPLAAKAGISPLFLKAVLSISSLKPDFYLPFSFKQNSKAVSAANELNFELFIEYYFGDHYVKQGLAQKLKEAYEAASSDNKEFE